MVDFGQERPNLKAKIIALEYDPYRTAFIALLEYKDGVKRYRLACQNLKTDDEVITSEKAELQPGNRMLLANIPVGTIVYNIELQPNRGGKIVRSAGTGAKILAHEGKYCHLEMPSKEIRKILEKCYATIGSVSYSEHRYQKIGKAGANRWRRKRPTVRGSAMVPADHPHGGGEGRTGIGMKHPKTPWGKPARGVKTRRRKITNKYIIKRRVKKKK
jgi:large subunit ribosomal protein L2